MTRVAFIVPTLNEAANVRATLGCLGPWRQLGHEVVVVDGGSHDDTVAHCQPLADRVVAGTPGLRGRARQMNAGAHATNADVLVFLHADTRLPDAALSAIEGAVKRGALWGRLDVVIEGKSRWLPWVARLMNLRSRVSGIATGDQAMFVRRDAFERVGGFPDQPLMEDVEISRRLLRLARPACLHERAVTSGRRWDERGAFRTIVLMWRLRWRYWRGVDAAVLAKVYR